MADKMAELKTDSNLVVFGFVTSPYVDSVSNDSHFWEFLLWLQFKDGWQT